MKNNKKKGFTLVELLVVIAILAILATVATVGYTAFIESATVSNDENVAAQLNQFLAAVKVDSNGPFYGKDINEDNIMELTQYILDDSGYGDLIPQAAKYGYHFYFDLEEEKYVVIGDKDERILSMSPLSMLFASAAGESTNGHPESCFTEGRRYFLVETGTELSELVAGFKNITTADGLKEYYAKVSDYKTDAKQSLTGLITLVEKTVFATAEGYLVVEDAGHTVLFVPANLDGVKLSGVKVNVLNNKATTPISSENPLITLGDGYVFNIPKPEMIFGNALWFDGEHYTPDENGEYTTTLKFNLSLEEIKAIVDQNFTNVVFKLNDGKQYGYIDGAIVCLTDGTSTEVTSKVGVQSFKIGIEGKTEEGAYSVPFDVAKTEAYKMYAYGFVSTDSFNPDNVPDETVTWEIVEDQYTPDNANIDENGVITGVSAGIIRVKAISTVTNTATAEFIINIGSIDGILGIAYANGNGSNSGTIEFDANTGEPDEIINHQINNESNNNFTFTVTPNYYFANITNCDDTFSVEIEGDVQVELDQANNTASVNFTKAGTYTITVAYVAYPEVSRTFTVKVTNVVTGFEVGYMDGANKVTGLIYKDFNEVNGTTFDMNVFATTSDGSDNMTGHTVTWSCVGPNGDVAIDTDGKFTVSAAGLYTISATVDGTTKEFNLYVDSPLRPEISFNGTKADIDDEKVDNKFAAEMPGDYYYQMGSVAGNKIPFTVAVKYTYGVTFGNITPDITTSDNATYENSYLTITKAGDVVVTISVPGYPELTTVFTVEARNKVTGLDLTVNNTTNSVEKIDDKFYIIPGADNNFTVDASFTFQYEGEKINPDITWSVESGAEYVECTKNGEIIGTFHIKAKPATGTVITIKATDSVNNLEKTIKIVINELTSFDLNCSDIMDGDKVKLHAIGNTIYVAYDLTTGSFTLTPTDFKGVDNAPVPPSSVTWSTSDTAGEYISIDNGTVTIKKALMDDITITATAAGGKTVTMGIKLVTLQQVTFGDGTFTTLDSVLGNNTITIAYLGDGNKAFTPTITERIYNNSISGVTVDETLKVELINADAEKGETTVFTKEGNTIKLIDTATGVVEGKQRVKLTVGNLSEEITITVVDNSLNPIDTKLIVDAENNNNQVNYSGDIKIGETYLFRVGNKNEFKLSDLFEEKKSFDSISLAIYDATRGNNGVYPEINTDGNNDNNFDAVYTTPTSVDGWENTTIKFSGTGVAQIVITTTKSGKTSETKLLVEVLDAKNVTTDNASAAFGGSVVLLSDITLSSSRSISNGTLYGNGYTIYAREYVDTIYKALINLTNANIDNVCIIGGIYSELSDTYGSNVVNVLGDCMISNSYIYGMRNNVRVYESSDIKTNLVLDNTTLAYSTMSNMEISKCTSLTLRNVTTIQAPIAATLPSDTNKTVIGLGLYVTDGYVTIKIEGDFRQFNWICSDYKEYITDDMLLTGANIALSMSQYQHQVNGKTYVNTGVIFTAPHTGDWIDNRDEDVKSKVAYHYETVNLVIEGGVYSYYKTPSVKDNMDRFTYGDTFTPAQALTMPTFTIDYSNPDSSYCEVDSKKKTFNITVNEGEELTFNINRLKANKYGVNLDVVAKVEKLNMTNLEWETVEGGWPNSFTDSAPYRITYTYTDDNHYDKDGNSHNDAITYTQSILINVTVVKAVAVPPTFKYTVGGKEYEFEIKVIDDNSYVSAKVSETSADFGAKIITDKSGVQHTIYYVIRNEKNNEAAVGIGNGEVYRTYWTFPDGFSIVDGDVTYSASTNTLAAIGNNVRIVSRSDGSTNKTIESIGVLKASGMTLDAGDFNGRLGQWAIWNAQKETPAQNITYTYVISSGGIDYTYYIEYRFPKRAATCVTPDTLVTLADGTQKEIQYVTHEDKLLVWNFESGKYDVAPASIVKNHGYNNYTVTDLMFDDGTIVSTINGHGFYDAESNKFVVLDNNNVADYIGHKFVKQNGNTYTTVTLVNYSVREEYTESWSILTAVYHNAILEGMFTLTPAEVDGSPDYLMPFEIVNMKYDEALMQADIERYGLYEYEDFADYITYEEFIALNLKYFKVAVGKGSITYDEIMYLIDLHCGK